MPAELETERYVFGQVLREAAEAAETPAQPAVYELCAQPPPPPMSPDGNSDGRPSLAEDEVTPPASSHVQPLTKADKMLSLAGNPPPPPSRGSDARRALSMHDAAVFYKQATMAPPDVAGVPPTPPVSVSRQRALEMQRSNVFGVEGRDHWGIGTSARR